MTYHKEEKITTVPREDHVIIQTLIRFYCMTNAHLAGKYKAQGFTERPIDTFRVDTLVRFFPSVSNRKMKNYWIAFEVQDNMKDPLFNEKIKMMKEKAEDPKGELTAVIVIPVDSICNDRNIDHWKEKIEGIVQDTIMAYVR